MCPALSQPAYTFYCMGHSTCEKYIVPPRSVCPALSAHSGAIRPLEDIHQAPHSSQDNVMKAREKVSALRISPGDGGRKSQSQLYVNTMPHTTTKACTRINRLAIAYSEKKGKHNKEPCSPKSFILTQGKTYKSLFVLPHMFSPRF